MALNAATSTRASALGRGAGMVGAAGLGAVVAGGGVAGAPGRGGWGERSGAGTAGLGRGRSGHRSPRTGPARITVAVTSSPLCVFVRFARFLSQ